MPCQLDLADHGDPGLGRGDQQRMVGTPPRRRDDQRRPLGQDRLSEAHLDPGGGQLGGRGPLPLAIDRLQDDDPLTASGEAAGGGRAGHPQPGDDDTHCLGIHSR
jgi:hypothetical protein